MANYNPTYSNIQDAYLKVLNEGIESDTDSEYQRLRKEPTVIDGKRYDDRYVAQFQRASDAKLNGKNLETFNNAANLALMKDARNSALLKKYDEISSDNRRILGNNTKRYDELISRGREKYANGGDNFEKTISSLTSPQSKPSPTPNRVKYQINKNTPTVKKPLPKSTDGGREENYFEKQLGKEVADKYLGTEVVNTSLFSKPEKTTYKKLLGGDIEEAYRKVIESADGRVYAYHCTNTDPRIIADEGFNVHSDGAHGFTEQNQFELLYENYLPYNPCFISKDHVWDGDAKYKIKIDITGLELFPDFGHLLDAGAYYDEPDDNGDTLFWWKGRDWEYLSNQFENLKRYLNKTNGYLHSENFTGNMSWNMIGTACIDGDELTKDRIVEINGKKVVNGTIEESFSSIGGTPIRFADGMNESVYDDYSVDILNILEEFKDDKSRGIAHKQWNLIDQNQYAYALSKFVREGPELFKFSERVIDDWIEIIVNNIKEIECIGILDGREEYNGGDDIDPYMIMDEFPEEYDSEYEKLSEKAKTLGEIWHKRCAAMNALDSVGFYRWAILPDGNPADSDNGIAGVREILENIDENSSISEKIVAINKCMDVFQQRSDFSSAFIKGGRKSLDAISDNRIHLATYNPIIESNGGFNSSKSNNKLSSQKLKTICDNLVPFSNGEFGFKDEVIEKIITDDVRKLFYEMICTTRGLSKNSKRIDFKIYFNTVNKDGLSSQMMDFVRSSMYYNIINYFGNIFTDIYFERIGGNECVGGFSITDENAVSYIKRFIYIPKYTQMELL